MTEVKPFVQSLVTVDVLIQTADASKYGILFSGISAVVYVYALMFVCVPSPELGLWLLSAVLLCLFEC